jgi:hypothetical protein
MLHHLTRIADTRNLNVSDFLSFGYKNKEKYAIDIIGHDLETMMVSTWYSNDLVNDYLTERT